MYDERPEHPRLDRWRTPSATTACGIQIKYSIYGNYADYVSSLTYGVRFGFTPGFGGSVVTDLTLFDPNVVPTLGQ